MKHIYFYTLKQSASQQYCTYQTQEQTKSE